MVVDVLVPSFLAFLTVGLGALIVPRLDRLEKGFVPRTEFDAFRDEMRISLDEIRTEIKEIRAEIKEIRTEMHAGNDALRKEMHAGNDALRKEMRDEIGALRREFREEAGRLRSDLTHVALALGVPRSQATEG